MRWSNVNWMGLLLLSASAFSQPVEMNNTSVKEFVSWYAKSTGKPIVISPDVTGTINVFSADVSDEQLPAFFTSVLRANGFDLSPGNPSVITKMTHSPYEYPETMNQADYDALKLPPVPTGKPDGTFLNARSDDNLITETYPVNHVRAQDLAPVVDAFLKTTGSTGKAFPFDGANLIAVSASPSQHARLRRFLPDIDKSVDQVFIQSLMFEVSEGESFDFSFASGSQSGHRLAGGVNTDRLGSALSSAGGAFGIFDGNVLALTLRAVQGNSHARVLSTPQILTMSGQKGYISVGQNVPFVTGRVTGEAANVSNPFQTIERHDVGVSLRVSPVVLSSGSLVMNIMSRADSISSQVTTASDIVTNQRQIETTVQIRDGQTLLIGGLLDDRSSNNDSSVPILSSIPLIGRLFTSSSDSTDRRSLFVMLRANIIHRM